MTNTNDLNTAVRRYVGLVAALAGISVVVPLLFGTVRHSGSPLPLAALLFVAVILAQRFPIHLTDKTKVYVDAAILTAAVLMLPPMIAVAIAVISAATYELIARVSWEQAIFNVAQTALYVGAGAWIYYLLAVPRTAVLTRPVALLAALLSIAAMHLINTLAVAVIAALQLGKPPVAFWLDGLLIDLPEHALLVANGVLFALTANSFPWIMPLLVGPLVIVYLSLRQRADLRATTQTMIDALADLSDLLCRETPGHSRRVAERTRQLAEHLGVPQAQANVAVKAAQLQSLGLVTANAPDNRHADVLDLPRSATFATIVPSHGAVTSAIRHLHERWDGSGGPDGLLGEAIPLPARLVAVADAFERSFDGGSSPTADDRRRAADTLAAGAGRAWDPRIVSVLTDVIRFDAIGAD